MTRSGRKGPGFFAKSSFRLNARKLDHFAPFLCFLGDEPAEVGGQSWKHAAAEVSKPLNHFGFSKGYVDFAIELVNYFNGSFLGRAKPRKQTRLVARQEIGNDRHVRQRPRTHGCSPP